MKQSKLFSTSALGLFGAVLVGQGVAMADSLFVRDRNISVLDRERPEYAAPGIQAGQFIIKPKLDIGIGWISNAFAASDIPNDIGFDRFEDESDIYGVLRPSVSAESTWSRHAIAAGAYAEFFRNSRFDSETVTDRGVWLNAQYDVSRKMALFGGMSYDSLNEIRRVNNTSILFDTPVSYHVATGYAGLQQELGAVRYKVRTDVKDFDYNDVTLIETGIPTFDVSPDQDFRDRISVEVLGEVAAAFSRDVALLVRGIWNHQDYDQNSVPNSVDRNSDGWALAVGAEFDFSQLIRGNVAMGYFEQDYKAAEFSNLDGTWIDGTVEWFPTERTTLTLSGSRGADESALIASGGYISSELQLRIDHELRRNLLAYGVVGAAREDYRQASVDQEIEKWGAGAGLTYYHTPQVSTGLDYSFESQQVEQTIFEGGFDTDYNVHELLWTLSLER